MNGKAYKSSLESKNVSEVEIPSLTKSSTEKETVSYYKEIIKSNCDKYKKLIKSGPSSLESAEAKGLATQLKRDFSILIISHPEACFSLGEDVFSQLWQFSYAQISCFRKALEVIKKSKDNNADLQKKFVSHYIKFLDKTSDFYRGFSEKLNEELCKLTSREETERIEQFWNSILYECEVCKGDVARYRETVSSSKMFTEAENYYLKAVELDPLNGQAYNQLATIMAHRKRFLISAAYYIRAFLAPKPFQTAEDNLNTLLKAQILNNPKRKEIIEGMNESVEKESKTRSDVSETAIFYFLYILSKLLKGVREIPVGMEIKEKEIKALKLGLDQLFSSQTVSKQIMISFAVIIIYCIEKFKLQGGEMDRAAYIMDICVASAFGHVKNLSVLVFLSTMVDYLSQNQQLWTSIDFSVWSLQDLNELANKAPMSTMSARFPLSEEETLIGFLPIREKIKGFVDQGKGFTCIKENEAAAYRAKKITSFLKACGQTEDENVNEISGSLSKESDEDFSEEILLKPSISTVNTDSSKISVVSVENIPQLERNFSLTELLFDGNVAMNDLEGDVDEGVVTGYTGDEDGMLLWTTPREFGDEALDAPPGFGY